jgi:integrase
VPEQHKKKAIVYDDELVLNFYRHANACLKDLVVIGSENPLRPHENREVRWEMVSGHDSGSGPVEYDLPYWFVKKGARRIQLSGNAAAIVRRRWRERSQLSPRFRSPFVFPSPTDPQKPVSDVRLSRWWLKMRKEIDEARAKDGLPPLQRVQFHWFRHNVFRRLTKVHGISTAKAAQIGGTSERTVRAHYDLEEESARMEVAKAISLPFGESRKEGR